jgi:hypothetical protein
VERPFAPQHGLSLAHHLMQQLPHDLVLPAGAHLECHEPVY